MVQAEEVAAEITRKLKKQEKKRLKKEKSSWLPLLLHLQKTAVVLQRSVRRSVKDPKSRKSKSSKRLLRNMEWKIHQTKKNKSFSKEELISSDLEEIAGSRNLPKRKKSFPKEEPVSDPEEAGNGSVPKKKRKFFSEEELLRSGPEEVTGSKSSSSKKKKKLQTLSQGD